MALAVLAVVPACSGEQAETDSACRDYQTKEAPPADAASYLIVVDADSNAASTSELLSEAAKPLVRSALKTGGYLKVIVDPGRGHELMQSSCMSGEQYFLVKRDNTRRQDSDITNGVDLLTARITALVESAPVSDSGSATRVLRYAADYKPRGTGPSSVLIWSSLLGHSADRGTDCLALDGVVASPSAVASVVSRCLTTSQLAPIDADDISIAGAGTTAVDPEQSLAASLLEGELCRKIASNCPAES